jgi:hypothetical protein
LACKISFRSSLRVSKRGYIQLLYNPHCPNPERDILRLLNAKQRHSGKRTRPEPGRSRAETPYGSDMQPKSRTATEKEGTREISVAKRLISYWKQRTEEISAAKAQTSCWKTEDRRGLRS